ncbi:aldolase [Opitutus sp. GAS368]|uniref:class I fructose-bisphosphate aldolase n=1 Tax=Opitutus sp. GAS368 TaxID=1882749 RepID=UPI00087C8A79|nr:aldolase [Opitutus sp. GAS368]SDS48462.1 Fructose-bisphosphate aldolase class Ia, DhnA family [Opitutus sp. GAS368]
MTTYRLNRLFHPVSRRCFDVAIDHGFFNEYGFLAGIENIGQAVAAVVGAAPDAIQLTVGQAAHLQELPGRLKPSLVLRIDVANVYGQKLPRRLYSRMIVDPVAQALRLDAACMCVNLFQIPGEPEVGEQCVENILRLKPDCERYGMPLMVEPLVFQANEKAGGYMVDGDEQKIIPLVRQAAELGANVIKADPTDNVQLYHQVVEAAGRVPVLVRGGGKVGDREILQRTHDLLTQGVAGIVYGRNIIQHAKPAAITRALMGIVHEGMNVDQAMVILQN